MLNNKCLLKQEFTHTRGVLCATAGMEGREYRDHSAEWRNNQ